MKAVITAAGFGTRMLPATKEIPKEMFPVLTYKNGKFSLRPTLQVIFESLYEVGIRNFCFVVNRFKRVIENHFSPDYEYVDYLLRRGKYEEAEDLKAFYNKIKSSNIVYVNQYEPLGFGHAVLITESFIGNEPFIVHAGDDYIVANDNKHIKQLLSVFKEFDANAVILLEKARDPRKYGVVSGEYLRDDVFEVRGVVEKPLKPPSNLAIIAIYVFKPVIFNALKRIPKDPSGELPLSAAIDYIAKNDGGVYGVILSEDEYRVDVGNPDTYINGLFKLYQSYRMVGESL